MKGDNVEPGKKKILIADDQSAIRNMLAELLKSRGYDCHLAENGEEAVRMAKEVVPDLIIMDVMMPLKNGFEAAREIKGTPESAAAPILFLTARGQAQDEQAARDAGGAGFMAKPFSPKLVLAKIVELLALKA